MDNLNHEQSGVGNNNIEDVSHNDPAKTRKGTALQNLESGRAEEHDAARHSNLRSNTHMSPFNHRNIFGSMQTARQTAERQSTPPDRTEQGAGTGPLRVSCLITLEQKTAEGILRQHAEFTFGDGTNFKMVLATKRFEKVWKHAKDWDVMTPRERRKRQYNNKFKKYLARHMK